MDNLQYIALFACPLAIFLIAIGIGYISIAANLDKTVQDKLRLSGLSPDERYERPFFLKWADRIEKAPWIDKVSDTVNQTYLPVRPAGFVGLAIGATLMVYFILWAFLDLNFLVNFMISIAFTWAGFRMLLANRRDYYINQLADQMPQVAILLSNSLRAGMSVNQGLQIVASKSRWPTDHEFGTVVYEINLGTPLATALTHLAERVPLEEVYTINSTIQVVHQSGGDLSRALANMANAIMDRQRARSEIKTLTSEARFTGFVLLIMPIFMLFMLNAVRPGSVGDFLNQPLGWVVMAAFISVQYGCYALINRFADVKI